jgi:O-antigen ligase
MRNPILEEMRQGQGIIDIVNSYLQYALEFGLVGLGLFLLLILVVLRGVWRTRSAARKSNDIEVAILGRTLLAAMGGILVTIATVSSIFSIPALYWLIIGACVAYIRQFGYKHLQANTETARPYGQPRSEDKHAITPAGQSL